MKDLTNIQPQQKAKSIADFTPFELAIIDQYQDDNRGFDDDDKYLPLENWEEWN